MEYLLQHGADPTIMCYTGKLPSDLTRDKSILSLLPHVPSPHSPQQQELPIIPNYLQNPVFPYNSRDSTEYTVPVQKMSNLDISQESEYRSQTIAPSPLKGISHMYGISVNLWIIFGMITKYQVIDIHSNVMYRYMSLLSDTTIQNVVFSFCDPNAIIVVTISNCIGS